MSHFSNDCHAPRLAPLPAAMLVLAALLPAAALAEGAAAAPNGGPQAGAELTAGATVSASATAPRATQAFPASAGGAVLQVNASGSVLFVASRGVVGSRLARIEPPAPGFVYER